MLVAVAIVSSTPLLVPELAGTAAAEVADLRDAVLTAAASLPDIWIAVAVGARDAVSGPEAVGTFGGYGADVGVGLSPATDATPAELPLGALVTGWIRGRVNPAARALVHTLDASSSTADARARGRALRAQIDADGRPAGVLVVADGCHTLTPGAPGGHDPASVPIQARLDAALAAGDVVTLGDLPDSVVGRAAYAALAGLSDPGPSGVEELYRGAPFGVGHNVCIWQP